MCVRIDFYQNDSFIVLTFSVAVFSFMVQIGLSFYLLLFPLNLSSRSNFIPDKPIDSK